MSGSCTCVVLLFLFGLVSCPCRHCDITVPPPHTKIVPSSFRVVLSSRTDPSHCPLAPPLVPLPRLARSKPRSLLHSPSFWAADPRPSHQRAARRPGRHRTAGTGRRGDGETGRRGDGETGRPGRHRTAGTRRGRRHRCGIVAFFTAYLVTQASFVVCHACKRVPTIAADTVPIF